MEIRDCREDRNIVEDDTIVSVNALGGYIYIHLSAGYCIVMSFEELDKITEKMDEAKLKD